MSTFGPQYEHVCKGWIIYANVLKQITGSIQRSPLVQKDLEFLKAIPAQKMADSLPNTLENTTIDLLIGSDYLVCFCYPLNLSTLSLGQ